MSESGRATTQKSVWDVYGSLRSPQARKYLIALAASKGEEGWRLIQKAGISPAKPDSIQKALDHWRAEYPGFRELEEKLISSPAFAGRFLSICILPTAVQYMADVLAEKERGNRQEAAKFIINVSGASRADAKLADAQVEKAAPNSKTLLQRFEAVSPDDDEEDDDD